MRERLNSAMFGPSDLDGAASPSLSLNCLDCFENLNEFEYL